MITPPASPGPSSTRDRLIDAGLRLFAERGFQATTVGDIESAAGLRPRRGALYRHFRSKDLLLEAAVRRHLDAVREGRTWILDLPPGDVHAEAIMLGSFVLRELEAERELTDIFERDRDRLGELRTLFREQISDVSYLAMAEVLRRWAGAPVDEDLDALGVLLLGSLVNVHRSTHTLGAPPLALDEQRVVTAWAQQCVSVIDSLR